MSTLLRHFPTFWTNSSEWLVPALPAAIVAEIPNGHDDPLNSDIDSFANSLDQLIDRLE